MTMIEKCKNLKSSLEGKAEHLADKLVPYTFLGTGLVWMFTRNVTKALSVLMVDFSCALKLSMPLAVLSAIREASTYEITVKGGKYLEAMADATTIVFDKTGTLTKAQPTVADVVSFNGQPAEELLRISCLPGGAFLSLTPVCGSDVYEGKQNFYCSNRQCDFALWKENRFLGSMEKTLDKKMAVELLDKACTHVKGLYSRKKDIKFDADLLLTLEDGKPRFHLEFPKKKKK